MNTIFIFGDYTCNLCFGKGFHQPCWTYTPRQRVKCIRCNGTGKHLKHYQKKQINEELNEK